MGENQLERRQGPLRRYVRARCQLQIGRHCVDGLSHNVSSAGLCVHLAPRELPRPALAELTSPDVIGTQIVVTLSLPEQSDPLKVGAELLWVNSNHRNTAGRQVVGAGLRFSDPAGLAAEAVQAFLDRFRHTVVVVDDDAPSLELIRRMLSREFRVIACASPLDALERVENEEIALLITDHRMPGMNGVELLKAVSQRRPRSHLARIFVSAYLAPEEIEELVNVGQIFHFLRKPVSSKTLVPVVRRAVEAYAMAIENEELSAELQRLNDRLQRENAYLRRRVVGLEGFEQIVGSSTKLHAAFGELERIRKSEVTVHIRGETGTGKELVARALHHGGPRAKRPFVAHNCGGMTETLLQSTLFGHRRGAFTGADRDHPGVFVQANRGTLFLDEVAELPAAVQASLLRVLQDGCVTPLGATEPARVDVRIMSATHKDLRKEVQAGRFREDLYFRLVVIDVQLPPLRERSGDIPLLAQHFLDVYCERHGKDLRGFSMRAMTTLERYAWPGNVRELENVVQRMVVLADDGQKITDALLPAFLLPKMQGSGAEDLQDPPESQKSTSHGAGEEVVLLESWLSSGRTLRELMREFERRVLAEAMHRCGGNQAAAAKMLGLPRQTLWSRLQKLDP